MNVMKPEDFFGKKVTVMGLGVHGGGFGVASWLVKRGAKVTVTDLADEAKLSSSIRKLEREAIKWGNPVKYVLGRHRRSDFIKAHLVVRNPAVPQSNEFLVAAREYGVPIESDISLLFLMCPHPICAVTGTKGKSTVTNLLHAIAKEHDPKAVMGGNVRISPFSWFDRVYKAKRAMPIVLELSSWQLEDLEQHRLSPHVGVITNVLPDHLNRYNGFEDYAETKELAVAFQRFGDWAVLPYGDDWLREVGEIGSAVPLATDEGRRFWFSRKRPKGVDGCFVLRGSVVVYDQGVKTEIMPVEDIKLPGDHNLGNVLASVASAWALGVPPAVIRRAVKRFSGVPHRQEVVRVKSGVTYVNDTTATMPDATVAALKTWGGKRRAVLICGGADKELVFDGCLGTAVAKHAKEVLAFPGTATEKLLPILKRFASGVQVREVGSMSEAVGEAQSIVEPGDVVLLSPGAASFGLFSNEFDRGEKFRTAVKSLK